MTLHVCIKHSTAGKKGHIIDVDGEKARQLREKGLVVPYDPPAPPKPTRKGGRKPKDAAPAEFTENQYDSISELSTDRH